MFADGTKDIPPNVQQVTMTLMNYRKIYQNCLSGQIYGSFFLTLKMPRKPASKNFICLCHLLNILVNFSNLFLRTGKQYGP